MKKQGIRHVTLTNTSKALLLSLAFLSSSCSSTETSPPAEYCSGDECGASTVYDLSQYDIPFSFSWPTPPKLKSAVNVTPSTISVNNVSGRQIVLSPGAYGPITTGHSDQEFVLQEGAVVESFRIGPTARRIVVRGETPRVGVIRSVVTPKMGGPRDIMFNGVHFEHTPRMTGTTAISFNGTRIALVNSSAHVGGYIPSSFNFAENALVEFICAGNRFVSDHSVAKAGQGAQSMGRMVDSRKVVFVGNWMEKVDNGAGMRFHGDRFGSRDLYIADNTFINRGRAGGGFIGVLFSLNPGGSGGTPVGHDRVVFDNNVLYHGASSKAFIYDTNPRVQATNVTFTNNKAYAYNPGFPQAEKTWKISGNTQESYKPPPDSRTKLGF